MDIPGGFIGDGLSVGEGDPDAFSARFLCGLARATRLGGTRPVFGLIGPASPGLPILMALGTGEGGFATRGALSAPKGRLRPWAYAQARIALLPEAVDGLPDPEAVLALSGPPGLVHLGGPVTPRALSFLEEVLAPDGTALLPRGASGESLARHCASPGTALRPLAATPLWLLLARADRHAFLLDGLRRVQGRHLRGAFDMYGAPVAVFEAGEGPDGPWHRAEAGPPPLAGRLSRWAAAGRHWLPPLHLPGAAGPRARR